MSRYLSQDTPSELDRWLFNQQKLTPANESLLSGEVAFPGDDDDHDIADWRRHFWSKKSVLELGAGLGECIACGALQ